MSLTRILGRCLLTVGLVSARAVAAGADDVRDFSRSLYLPVRFASCPNLARGILYESLEPVGTLPLRRVYQFTYYSDKDRFLPESYQLDLTMRDAVRPRMLRASLTVSLEGILIGDRFIHRNLRKEVEAQLKRRRDARFEEAKVVFHCTEVEACPDACPRADGDEETADISRPNR